MLKILFVYTRESSIPLQNFEQGASVYNDFTLVYDEGKTSIQANGLMLRAAYPALRSCTVDALVLPTADQATIDIILEIAYIGRSCYPMPQLSSAVIL